MRCLANAHTQAAAQFVGCAGHPEEEAGPHSRHKLVISRPLTPCSCPRATTHSFSLEMISFQIGGHANIRPPAMSARSARRGRKNAQKDGMGAQSARGGRNGRAQTKRSLAPTAGERLPYGLLRHDAETLSAESALFYYERDQLLWLRLGTEHRRQCAAFGLPALRTLQRRYPALFQNHWSVENPGEHAKESLSPASVFGARKPPSGPFYVSSILQKDDHNLSTFFSKVPFAEAPVLRECAQHDDGVWLFVGLNQGDVAGKTSKRKREEAPGALRGRPEHTDAVDHSGTWHVQLSGKKTWIVRPCAEACDWQASPPVLDEGKEGVVSEGRGGTRLRIDCEEGDLLLINTRAWWHRTELLPQKGAGFSISYARDFYLGSAASVPAKAGAGSAGGTASPMCGVKTNDETLDPRMFAARRFKAGEVVLEELPDAELPRADDPNCAFAELDDGSEALVALRRIHQDEPLTVGVGEESDGEYEVWELDPETGEMVRVED